MNLKDFYTFVEKIKTAYENGNSIDANILLINILILTIIFCVYFDIRINEIFKQKNVFILLGVNVSLVFVLHILIGNIVAFIPIIVFFGIQLVMFLKNKEYYKKFKSNKDITEINSSQNNQNNNIKNNIPQDIQVKMKKLGKESNFNLLDILYIYDYISDYQRRKIIQSLISESTDTDKMAEKLLTTYTISDTEFKEAKAILNIINLEGKLITKEEAMLYLLKIEQEGEKENHD